MTRQPIIAHLSADFPDPFIERKTPVIRALLELTKDSFTHRVVSINRGAVAPFRTALAAIKGAGTPELEYERRAFADGVALSYRAPPRGIMHATMLRQLGNVIAQDMLREKQLPDLLIGHKLTVEGIAVAHAAAIVDRPYALTIQGNTDVKILRARPDLRPLFRRIFHGAAQVMSFAPWSLEAIEARLGSRAGSSTIVPPPTELDAILPPKTGGNGLLTIFHLHGLKNKNLSGLVAALHILERRGRKISLAIVGDGNDADRAAAKALVGDLENVTFEGALSRDAIGERLNSASAFVLPSRRESFGLVFTEALFAGCPIIYPEGRAVDGYFKDSAFALFVDPMKADQIAAAIERMIDHEAETKSALRRWQDAGGPQIFARTSIKQNYTRALMEAVGEGSV
ncbi:glycosyltransferase family 4 protein [Erythrobacter alti]|uniref:glycosyltransferase family 4 protein n=1 Tax=Erythrobacter alti TaxID=1896145 RepID=UPI0030F3EF15